MAMDIKINNPEEVKQSLRRVEAALILFDEYILQEKTQLCSVATMVQKTQQHVNSNIYGLQIAIEQAKKNKDLDGAEDAIQQYRQLLEGCEEQARTLNQCNEELQEIQADYSNIAQRSSGLAKQGQMVYEKTRTLIERIVDAR